MLKTSQGQNKIENNQPKFDQNQKSDFGWLQNQGQTLNRKKGLTLVLVGLFFYPLLFCFL